MIEKYILLVEDNPDDVVLTELAFRKAQVANRLMKVTDGQEALDFLFYHGKYTDRKPVEKPALVLLDLKLPYVSGLDVLKEIRTDKNTSRIPVIMLTSSLEDKDKTDSLKLGANDFILKPTGLSLFVEIIRQIKAHWLE
jgi:two-component system, response regulator